MSGIHQSHDKTLLFSRVNVVVKIVCLSKDRETIRKEKKRKQMNFEK